MARLLEILSTILSRVGLLSRHHAHGERSRAERPSRHADES